MNHQTTHQKTQLSLEMKPLQLTRLVVLATMVALVAASSVPVADVSTSTERSTQEEETDDGEDNGQIWPSGIVPYVIDSSFSEYSGMIFSYK